MALELSKTYQPSSVEEQKYTEWEKNGYFHVKASDPREAFTIVIPPPNVTGVLHMGHALDNTLQDILIRYKRMDGYAALWIPGTDHAGIATQNVVEKELAKDGKSRHQLGREKFLERVWQWKEKSGSHIVKQLRRLGSSCDWARERFTMDAGLSKAVRTVFVSLFNEGLIYRSNYLISWCPRCQTALSDLEVEHHEIDGELTYFQYKTVDGEKISVATTRPETMLGDTAVAVHTKDPRFSPLVGKMIQHPFIGRTFPIIADETVKKEFGTGAVKVTPAHDPNDYAMAKRHQLIYLTILDESGKVDLPGTPYHGVDRFRARKKIVEDLKANGLFIKAEPHRHAVGHCQRCRTVIEPRISEQWFVKVDPLAGPAIEAVRVGKTKFVPENWAQTYLTWMENIRDWCISRQLWWGHRIPVWYCKDCGGKTASIEDATECSTCHSKQIQQDPDVLDTWFSSALWPFSTLGWPEKTEDLKKFYPTSVLVTGFDIIFFWVARMMMMGLKFMKDVPFEMVHIHALIRDEKGQKMSKSKGNIVDPLDIMDKYGTDAFRFALAALSVQGRDILLSEKRIEGCRNFITKLWNASRFVISTLGGKTPIPAQPTTFPDRWIRSRLNQVIEEVRNAIDAMKFSEAAQVIYQFAWHEFCDWYLEMIKPHFFEDASKKERESSETTMVWVVENILRLLHPICPFVTEELWQSLPIVKPSKTIMLAPYPKDDGIRSDQDLAHFSLLQEMITTLRNIRTEHRIPPSKKIKAQFFVTKEKSGHWLYVTQNYSTYIEKLAGLENLAINPTHRTKVAALGLCSELEIVVPLEGLIDIAAEKERLSKEREQAQKDRLFLETRLADSSYRSKAPQELIHKDEEKLKGIELQLQKLDRSLALLES